MLELSKLPSFHFLKDLKLYLMLTLICLEATSQLGFSILRDHILLWFAALACLHLDTLLYVWKSQELVARLLRLSKHVASWRVRRELHLADRWSLLDSLGCVECDLCLLHGRHDVEPRSSWIATVSLQSRGQRAPAAPVGSSKRSLKHRLVLLEPRSLIRSFVDSFRRKNRLVIKRSDIHILAQWRRTF